METKQFFTTAYALTLTSCLLAQALPVQHDYVDLQPLTNAPGKPGLTLVFQDELNGSKNSMWRNGYCWGNSHPGAPFYNLNANYVQTLTSLKLITKKENCTAGNYVVKPYSSAMINSDPCMGTTEPVAGRLWKYGYFEVRCKNPKSQKMWPAFWLYGEGNAVTYENEIDVFEFGVGDCLFMTNHFRRPNEEHKAYGKALFSLPGQTYGNSWVTYGLRWEPNKLIWYINNKIVRIETDNRSVIPSVSMRVKVGSGLSDQYAPYDLGLPAVFPNEMEIDYVRIYQRADPTLPNPIFTINNSQSYNPSAPINIPFTSGKPVFLNASESYMPSQLYFIGIQRCDANGNAIGSEVNDWFSGNTNDNMSKFDITAFAQSKGLTLTTGNYYKVKIAGSSPWTELTQFVYLTSCSSTVNFKVNAQPMTPWLTPVTISYNNAKPRIIADLSTVQSCNDSYFIALQECSSSAVGIGTEINKWLTADDKKHISDFDVENFAKQNNFLLKDGSYYKLKIAVGPSWVENSQLLYINPCVNAVSLTINGQTNNINIGNGEDIIMDGSGSRFCNNNFFVEVSECTSTGNYIGSPIQEVNSYSTNFDQVYYYSVGRFDIRDLCKRKNLDLGCGKYYRIKLASTSPWQEITRIIYIQPCVNVNNTYQINGVNSSTYNFGDPVNTALTLYAPQSISCDQSYFLAVRKRVNGVLTGIEASTWLNKDQIYELRTLGLLDLKAFAADPNKNGVTTDGITLSPNSTYLVKLVASAGTCNANTWVENNKVIYFGTGSGKIDVTTSEDESNIKKDIKVYPNPTNEYIAISLPEGGGTIHVMDLQGRILKNIQITDSFKIIDVSDLSIGIYLIRGIFGDQVSTQKIEIVR